MKRIIVVLLFLTAVAAAYVAGNSPAQQAAPKLVVKYTKVGIVNYATLINGYDKVKAIKDELKKEVEPFVAKKAELEKMAAEWIDILKNPSGKLTDKNIARGQHILLDCRRQLEDLDLACKSQIGKRLDNTMAQLWNEVNDKVRQHAELHGYHVILGHGEAEMQMSPMQNWQRKARVIDTGGLTMAHAAGAVDVTMAVLKSLNDTYRAGQPVQNDSQEGDSK